MAGFLIMFLPQFLIISSLTQLPYPYGNIKMLLWSENICKRGGRYTCVYVSEWGKRLVSSTVSQSLISPVRYFTALLLTHFSTHFTTTLFAAHLSLLLLPLSLFLHQNSMSKLMFLKAHSRKMLLTSFSLSVFNSFTAFILCSRGRKLMVIFVKD